MQKLKYIKRIFESLDEFKLISSSQLTAKISRPDGKIVTIEFDEDGEFEEEVDPPYVSEVSISGVDDDYRYTTSAYKSVGDDYEIIDDYGVDAEPLSEYQKRVDARKNKTKELMQQLKQKELDKKNKAIELGISEKDYRFQLHLEQSRDEVKRRGISQDGDLSKYAIAKTRYYDGEYMNTAYFKINMIGMEFSELESNYYTLVELGLSDTMLEDIPPGHELSRFIESNSENPIEYGISPKDAIKYISQLPFGADIYHTLYILTKY